MKSQKRIALVAHDQRKKDLIEWVRWNVKSLIRHELVCTGTTGRLVEEALIEILTDEIEMPVIHKLKSGPLGGDQQLGALIVEGEVDVIIFFWDPLKSQPHDSDVKALLRIAVLYNVAIACSRATADFIITSPLMTEEYGRIVSEFTDYEQREIKVDSEQA